MPATVLKKRPWHRPATLLKKIPWHRYFPVNFPKFLRTPLFIEHLWWLLLYFGVFFVFFWWFNMNFPCTDFNYKPLKLNFLQNLKLRATSEKPKKCWIMKIQEKRVYSSYVDDFPKKVFLTNVFFPEAKLNCILIDIKFGIVNNTFT